MSARAKKKARTNPLPSELSIPRVIREWQGEEYVQGLAWSPDGLLLAIAEISGRVTILDIMNGDIRLQTQAHALGCCHIAWRPHGNMLATGGQDGSLKIWNTENGDLLHTLGSGRDWIECLAWNQTGESLAFSQGRVLSVWSPAAGLKDGFPPMPSTILGVDWNPGGDSIAAAAYGGVTVFPLEGARVPREFAWKGSSLSIAWSPNGKYIASGQQDNCVHFWRVENGSDSQMHGYATKVRDIAWSPDSRFLATAGSDEITMWDFQGKGPEGRPPLNLEGHRDLVTALAFESSGASLVSGSADGGLILWDTIRRIPLWSERLPSGVTRVAWVGGVQTRLAAGDESGTVAIYDIGSPS